MADIFHNTVYTDRQPGASAAGAHAREAIEPQGAGGAGAEHLALVVSVVANAAVAMGMSPQGCAHAVATVAQLFHGLMEVRHVLVLCLASFRAARAQHRQLGWVLVC